MNISDHDCRSRPMPGCGILGSACLAATDPASFLSFISPSPSLSSLFLFHILSLSHTLLLSLTLSTFSIQSVSYRLISKHPDSTSTRLNISAIDLWLSNPPSSLRRLPPLFIHAHASLAVPWPFSTLLYATRKPHRLFVTDLPVCFCSPTTTTTTAIPIPPKKPQTSSLARLYPHKALLCLPLPLPRFRTRFSNPLRRFTNPSFRRSLYTFFLSPLAEFLPRYLERGIPFRSSPDASGRARLPRGVEPQGRDAFARATDQPGSRARFGPALGSRPERECEY